MSSVSSAELEVFPSVSDGQECEPSPSARSSPIAVLSCGSTGPTYLSSQMSPNSMVLTLEPQSTLFPAGFHAKMSPSPEKDLGLRGKEAVSGRTSPELLARYDPATSSWKTCQHCFIEVLETFSETWPRSGMMVNGDAFLHPRPASPIDGTGSG